MKKLMMLTVFLALTTSFQAQTNKQKDMVESQVNKNAPKPNEKWTVNKEVDENGNVVRYDSIYSWSSSGTAQALNHQNIDSIMKSFGNSFNQNTFSNSDSIFEDFFNNSSPESQDFFSQFFSQDSIQGNPNIDAIRKQMQALQNQFMSGMQPEPIIPSEPEPTPKKKSI